MAKEKKAFKMPHLLWIMLGMLIVCSILTYTSIRETYFG